MRRTRWRVLSGGLAIAFVCAATLTACAAPAPDVFETTTDFEAFQEEVRTATAARDAMEPDPPGPAWDARVPLPETRGWQRRNGCDLWLAAVSCEAWLGNGPDFDAMLDGYTAALGTAGWSRYDEQLEVIGQDLWTFVHPDHPSWTLQLITTGDYEGRAPELIVRAILGLPARDAGAASGGVAGTASVVPGMAPDETALPWSAATPGQAPSPDVAAQYCVTSFLQLRCLARAAAFPGYAEALAAAGWQAQGDDGALVAYRDPARGDSVLYLQSGPGSAELRGFIDANGAE